VVVADWVKIDTQLKASLDFTRKLISDKHSPEFKFGGLYALISVYGTAF